MSSVFDRGYPMIDATGGATEQIVAVGTSYAASSAFAATTKIVRLAANTTCFVEFGSSPTAAVASSIVLGAGDSLWAKVNSGEKVAVISHDSVATGKLSVVEMKSEF